MTHMADRMNQVLSSSIFSNVSPQEASMMDIATWKTDYGSIEKSQTSSETTLDSYKPCQFCDYLCSLHYHYNIQSRHRHYSQEWREPILMLLMWIPIFSFALYVSLRRESICGVLNGPNNKLVRSQR